MNRSEIVLGKEISIEELKTIQLDILDAIDEFCGSHNIRYSLACGSLLGAVRHKGYIPWDDDIDIYILRTEYSRMMKEFPSTYRGKYRIASLERNSSWDRPFAKAYDCSTVLFEDALLNYRIGVNIDIFPIDEVPENEQEWKSYDKRRRFQIDLMRTKFTPLDHYQSMGQRLVIGAIKVLSFWYSRRRWALHVDKLAQKNNGKGYSRCFECCLGMFQKAPFPKSLFDDIIVIPFENRKYKAFANADLYLRNGYGDYMVLPPIEKRVSHHVFNAFWK